MAIYINGTACISPQKSFLQEGFLSELTDHTTPQLSCIEPVYKEHINPTLARRLSRYIKMGVTTALTALKDSCCEMPGAVITGTGLGSTEDNEKILTAMLENQERMINPTHFIQSTHNTISSQIAIMLKCHNYNNTYVHRGFSFESALFDAMLLLQEGNATTALVGGVDALTEGHYVNFARIGRWRENVSGSLKMIEDKVNGVIPGEGSAHFLLSSAASSSSYAILNGLELCYKPDANEVRERCLKLLGSSGLQVKDIDLLITGENGDSLSDPIYAAFRAQLFPHTSFLYYKHLCGEFETAGAFALWLAANILKHRAIPFALTDHHPIQHPISHIRHLLIYSHHRSDQHVLYLLSEI